MSKTIIDVERMQFEFDEDWVVYQFDNNPDLQKIKKAVTGTKDTDIVALLIGQRGTTFYFMEVKDFRGCASENRPRLTKDGPDCLPQEFAQKVRDTIPALVGAYRTTGHEEQWRPFMKELMDCSKNIYAVLWLEQDSPVNPLKRKAAMNILLGKMQQRLDWLTPRVFVESLETYKNRLPGVTVKNLHGAGRPQK